MSSGGSVSLACGANRGPRLATPEFLGAEEGVSKGSWPKFSTQFVAWNEASIGTSAVMTQDFPRGSGLDENLQVEPKVGESLALQTSFDISRINARLGDAAEF